MVAKMAPMGLISLNDFHKRCLHPGKALSVYLHALKKPLSQPMPDLEEGVRILSGLLASVSRQLRATGKTTDLDKVMERARLLMTMEEQEHTAAVRGTAPTGSSDSTDRAGCPCRRELFDASGRTHTTSLTKSAPIPR